MIDNCFPFWEEVLFSITVKIIREIKYLEQGKVGMAHVVKGDLGIDPRVVLHLALKFVVDNLDWESIPWLVDALVKLAAKELDAHDGED